MRSIADELAADSPSASLLAPSAAVPTRSSPTTPASVNASSTTSAANAPSSQRNPTTKASSPTTTRRSLWFRRRTRQTISVASRSCCRDVKTSRGPLVTRQRRPYRRLTRSLRLPLLLRPGHRVLHLFAEPLLSQRSQSPSWATRVPFILCTGLRRWAGKVSMRGDGWSMVLG